MHEKKETPLYGVFALAALALAGIAAYFLITANAQFAKKMEANIAAMSALVQQRHESAQRPEPRAQPQTNDADISKASPVSSLAVGATPCARNLAMDEAHAVRVQLDAQLVAVQAFQDRIAELSASVAVKEARIRELEAVSARTGGSQEQKNELAFTRTKLEHVSGLYESLKRELKEIGGMITRKEEQVRAKEEEVKALLLENTSLRSRIFELEGKLKDEYIWRTSTQGKIDKLETINLTLKSRVAELVTVFQDAPRTVAEGAPTRHAAPAEPAAQGGTAQDRAEELKKRVEVLLHAVK